MAATTPPLEVRVSRHFLSWLDKQNTALSQLKAGIEAVEQRYADEAPPSTNEEYSRSIAQFDAMVAFVNSDVERHRSLFATYSARVDRYTAEVNEANALSEKIGSIRYVVPVPRVGGRASARPVAPLR